MPKARASQYRVETIERGGREGKEKKERRSNGLTSGNEANKVEGRAAVTTGMPRDLRNQASQRGQAWPSVVYSGPEEETRMRPSGCSVLNESRPWGSPG